MKRINQNNPNTPDKFDSKFSGSLGLADMDRLYALAKYYKGGTYVDVGCWDSIMPIILAERYPTSEIYGLDFAGEVMSYLGKRFPKVKYERIDSCYSLPFSDGEVDYVVAGEVIEHLEDPEKFIKECLRVIKPGGWLAISTPWRETDKQSCYGGDLHLWSFDEEDMKKFGFTEITTLKEERTISMLAWQQVQ